MAILQKRFVVITTLSFILITGSSVNATTEEKASIDELGLSLGDLFQITPTVTTSSLSEQKLDQVPGTMTVITDTDIRRLGFTTFSDVLETVPGFQYTKKSFGTTSAYARGYTWSCAHVKLMVDGHPVNDMFSHDVMAHWYYPLANVKQIEIIRGPGSALYGTDAFSAVVNIITKKEKRTAVSLSGGELYNFNGSISHYSDSEKDFVYGISLNFMNEKGDDLTYETDWLTGTTNAFTKKPLSLAPYTRNSAKRRIGGTLSLAYKDLKLVAGYDDQKLNWTEGFVNIMTEDPAVIGTRQWYADLSFSHQITSNSQLSVEGSFSRQMSYYSGQRLPKNFSWGGPVIDPTTLRPKTYSDSLGKNYMYYGLYPVVWVNEGVPGYYLDINKDGIPEYWPDGAYAEPGNVYLGDIYSMDILYQLKPLQNLNLTFGVQGTYENFWKVTSEANYSTMDFSKLSDTIGEVDGKDPNNFNWAQDEAEPHGGIFGQGIWDIVDNLALIAGVRYDYYKNAGQAISPRVAIVWDAFLDQIIKLSYGQAFSAPFATLQYGRAFGYFGNPDLKPQTIQTLELSWQNPYEKKLHYGFVVYGSVLNEAWINDNSRAAKGLPVYANSESYKLAGIEIEARYTPAKFISFWGNYAYSHAKGYDENDKEVITSEIVGPRHSGNGGISLKPLNVMDISVYTHAESGKPRAYNDPHKEWIPEFYKFNIALIYTGIKGITASIIAKNIFDKKQYTQNPLATKATAKSNAPVGCSDFPHDGRQIIGKISYEF